MLFYKYKYDSHWCWWLRWYWNNGRRVSANNGDDFVSVDFQSMVEADDDVVGKDTSGTLKSATSFQRQLDGFLKLPVSLDLARRVAVKVGVYDAKEGLFKRQIDVHET